MPGSTAIRLRAATAAAPFGALLVTLFPSGTAGQISERHTLDGEAVAVHNLVGDVRVVPSLDGRVEVAVLREGADGAELRVEVGPWGAWQAVRIHYPDADILYPEMGRLSRAEWRFGREDPLGRLVPGSGRVRVRGSGRGVDARAGITVYLPPGRRLEVHQALGSVEAENVEGEIALRVRAARVETRGTRGSLRIDGRSGPVQVRDAEGDLLVDTRSGGVTVERAEGGRVRLSTRSGSVRASDVVADDASIVTRSGSVRLEGARTGRASMETRSGSLRVEALRAGDLVASTRSGGIELRGLAADRLDVETRSGSVELDLAEPFDRGRVRTRSGRVAAYLPPTAEADLELRTSSRIEVDLPAREVERTRDRFTGRLGQGGATFAVQTRSGAIRLRPR